GPTHALRAALVMGCIEYCHVSRLLVSDCLMCFCVACRLMVSGWRVAAASRLRCGGEGADFHAEDGVERS
ncbi:hypothetical protein TGCOUG_362150, partial [Toxoplasma gondii COUG]